MRAWDSSGEPLRESRRPAILAPVRQRNWARLWSHGQPVPFQM